MLRVGINDAITLHTRLPAGAALGRLFVFARERGNDEFSPYVRELTAKLQTDDGRPSLLTPMMLRLTEQNNARTLQFTSDIDGWLRVMQEVDTALGEPKVLVRWSRKIAPQLPWLQRIKRYAGELWQ